MSERIRLVSLDLDLTTVDDKGDLYDGLDEVLDPSIRDFSLAIMTGRGWPRYRQAIEDNLGIAPDSQSLIALEHGSRVVDVYGNNVHYVPLPEDATDAVIDYIERDPDRLSSVSFYPKDTQEKTVTWSSVPPEGLGLGAAYYNNTVFLRDKADLYEAMHDLQPATLTCRVFEGHPEHFPRDLNHYSRGKNVNFLPPNVDKGVSGLIIADRTGIPLEETLYAGNDINDIPVFTLPGLGQPVIVGHELHHVNNTEGNPVLQLPDRKHTIYAGQGFSDERTVVLPKKTLFVPHHHRLGQVIFEQTRPRQGGSRR